MVRAMRNPAEQWERFGQLDPFYGVLSADEYRRENLTREVRDRFYETGEEYATSLFAELGEWRPPRVLDFGCGVGRVLIPLARRSDSAVGVDVSPSALQLARQACLERRVTNVQLLQAIPERPFDLVHSVLVLQHIPTQVGYKIFATLVDRLAPGGVGAIQLPVSGRLVTRLFYGALRLGPVAGAWNVARGRPWSYPTMQLNAYSLPRLLRILHRNDIGEVRVRFHAARGPTDLDSVSMLFRREPVPS